MGLINEARLQQIEQPIAQFLENPPKKVVEVVPIPVPPATSKIKLLMKYYGMGLVGHAASMAMNLQLSAGNICLHQYMSDRGAKAIQSLNYSSIEMHRALTPKNTFLQVAVWAPIIEEAQCRLLLQELLLKQLPKKILNKIAPQHAHLVDSKIAKITRVLVTSALFGVCHYIPAEHSRILFHADKKEQCMLSNRVIGAFVGGVLLGSLQEATGNVAYPILLHMLNNFIPALLMSNAGIEV